MDYVKKYWSDVLIGLLIVPQLIGLMIYAWTGFDFGIDDNRAGLLLDMAVVGVIVWVIRGYLRIF